MPVLDENRRALKWWSHQNDTVVHHSLHENGGNSHKTNSLVFISSLDVRTFCSPFYLSFLAGDQRPERNEIHAWPSFPFPFPFPWLCMFLRSCFLLSVFKASSSLNGKQLLEIASSCVTLATDISAYLVALALSLGEPPCIMSLLALCAQRNYTCCLQTRRPRMVGELMLISVPLMGTVVSYWASLIKHKHKITKNSKMVTAEPHQGQRGALLSSEAPHVCTGCTDRSWTWRHQSLCPWSQICS